MKWTVFLRPLHRVVSRHPQRGSAVVAARFLSAGRKAGGERKFSVPRKAWVLLGFGVTGGASLSLIKYFKSDRTSNCQSQVNTRLLTPAVAQFMATEVNVKEFGLIQRLQLFARFMYFCLLFSPVAILYGLSRLLDSASLSNLTWRYLLFAIQKAGPAFIKLGQWASTRRDLFVEEFCKVLSVLHISCKPHPWEETEKLMVESFGPDWQDTLSIVNRTPIGSGCVAQVYEGVLHKQSDDSAGSADGREVVTSEGVGGGIPVAVKVLHPHVAKQMRKDIFLMEYMASWVDMLYPDVHWVALTECVHEFSIIMQKQLDMRREASNLCKFKDLMINYAHIKFPTPLYPYITASVLVESFEPGEQISEYLCNPGGDLQKCLAKLGVEALLDMLFVHNFVHGDLHPGNILVQDTNVEQPKLVLLDCGIATSLEPLDLVNIHAVFTAIATNQGWKLADLFLNQKQSCDTLVEFRRRIGELVNTAISDLNLKKVRVDVLFSDLFNILIEHKVRIDPNFTSVMMAIMVLEGLGRSLDPELDILSFLGPCLQARAKKCLRESVTQKLNSITQAI